MAALTVAHGFAPLIQGRVIPWATTTSGGPAMNSNSSQIWAPADAGTAQLTRTTQICDGVTFRDCGVNGDGVL